MQTFASTFSDLNMMFLKIKIEESEILSIDMSGQPTRLQLLCFFYENQWFKY